MSEAGLFEVLEGHSYIRCKENPLLQHEELSFRVGGDALEWDQDHLQPEKVTVTQAVG